MLASQARRRGFDSHLPLQIPKRPRSEKGRGLLFLEGAGARNGKRFPVWNFTEIRNILDFIDYFDWHGSCNVGGVHPLTGASREKDDDPDTRQFNIALMEPLRFGRNSRLAGAGRNNSGPGLPA